MSETTPYILYGSHVSYATAKSRSYLRKKGIPFIERLPSAPRFREYVRPTSENHRIPQLEAPDGTVIQDTTAIFDYLEERFPEPLAYPPGPRQQLVARLFEVLLDAVLGRVAWHYRWNFMDENYGFVGREFGRSFRPQGSDEDLDHYGGVIADRMEKAADEITHWSEYDYVVVNDDFDASVARVRAILEAERLRRTRQEGLSDFVRLLRQGR